MNLRPHHLLCIQKFTGHGHSADFTAHMTAVVSELAENPETAVTLAKGCGGCHGEKQSGENLSEVVDSLLPDELQQNEDAGEDENPAEPSAQRKQDEKEETAQPVGQEETPDSLHPQPKPQSNLEKEDEEKQ